MLVKLALIFGLTIIAFDKVRFVQNAIANDLNKINFNIKRDIELLKEDHIYPRNVENSIWDNDEFDFEERSEESVLDKRAEKKSQDFCHSHWSTRKCGRNKKNSGNSTYVTCSSNSQCRHKHHCCSVHNHNNNGTIKCCVKSRKHKKKPQHQHTTNRTTMAISS